MITSRILSAVLAVLLAGILQAADQVVINTNDSGAGSLRQAIADVGPGEMITFNASLSGATLLLSSGQLTISNDVSIDASSLPGGFTIDANGSSRIMEILAGGYDVFLASLTITGGIGSTGIGDGGGIYNTDSTLVLTSCTLSENRTPNGPDIPAGFGGNGGRGGAIFNDAGNLTLNSCTLVNNSTGNGGAGSLGGRGGQGGAIYNGSSGSTTLISCSLAGNSTGDGGVGDFGGNEGGLGGCILNFGELTLLNCTISGNFTGDGASGMGGGGGTGGPGGLGGGVFNSGSCTITNSTIAENFTGNGGADDGFGGKGGGIYSGGGGLSPTELRIINSTISRNYTGVGDDGVESEGGGIFSGGFSGVSNLTLENSIVAGNMAAGGGNDIYFFASSGTITSSTSLVGINDSVESIFPAGSPNGSGDWVGTLGAPLIPLLAPLGAYGGDTETMPPLPSSPAIDSGFATTATPATDQRGFARPNGPLPDIGAVEAYAFSSFADTDSDGIPDILEGPGGPYPHLTVGVDDSAVDTDGDGSTDAEELANMTNLYDPNDFFRILSFERAAGFDPHTNPVFDVTISTFPGLYYQFEHQSDPSQPFNNLDPATPATDSTSTFEVTLDPGKDLLRAKRVPTP